MSATGLVIVMLVGPSEAADPVIVTAARTAEQSLTDTQVVVREVPLTQLDDREALRIGDDLRASAVIVISWRDDRHEEASLHAHRVGDREWTDRTFPFAPADLPLERGRTIGFEIASLIPAIARRPRVPDATSNASDAAPFVEAPSMRLAIEVLAVAASPTVGGGIGGGFGARVSRAWFGVRFGGSARWAPIPAATADATSVQLALGPTLRVIPERLRPFYGGIRIDALASWHHLGRTDGASGDSTLTSGVGGFVEGGLMEWKRLGLFVGVGVEVALHRPRILVDEREVTALAALRGVAEVGLRWEP